jgi:hypothetical protein
LEADNRPIPVHTGSSLQGGIHQVDCGGDATRRLGSIPGPTGRVSSPVHPQSIVEALVAPLHALGLKLYFYLDDLLLRNASKDILKTQMKLLIKNVKLAGWIMNEEKSDPTPSQDFIHWYSLLHPCGTNVPFSGQDRLDNVQSPTDVLSKVLSGKGILRSHWPTNLSGRSSPHGRLYLRPLQLILLSRWRPHRDPLDREIPLPESNILELNAVLLGVRHFRSQLKNQRVSLFSDNSTVEAYIRTTTPGGSPSGTTSFGTLLGEFTTTPLLFTSFTLGN